MTAALRGEERRLLEVPAEVDLGTGDLVLGVKGENLGIPSPSTAGGVGLIGNDHLVARLDQPDELEVLAAAGAGPATLEVAVTVELWVRWRREEKVIPQALLDEAPVAGCKRGICVASDLFAVGDGRPSLMPLSQEGLRRRRRECCNHAKAQARQDRGPLLLLVLSGTLKP